MQGKTHAVVGAASVLAFTTCTTLPAIATDVCFGVVGALMPDTDVKGSIGAKATKKMAIKSIVVCALFGLAVASGAITDTSFLTNWKAWISIPLLLGLAIFGATQPHRGVMHSIPMMLLASWLVYLLNPSYATPFAIGYASHLIIDLLNYKGEQLLFPLKKRFSLGLCKSDGVVNTIMLVGGALACAILVFAHLSRYGM